MPTPRIRYTVQRAMIFVAVLAIALGLADLRRRQKVYQERSAAYGERVIRIYRTINLLISHLEYGQDPDDSTYKSQLKILEWNHKAAGYLASREERYEYLASRPWVVASPDPIEPDYVFNAESGLR